MGVGQSSRQQIARDLYADLLPYTSLVDTLVSRPAAGVQGRTFMATDDNSFYVDDGVDWQEVSGGGGGAVDSVFGRTGDVLAAAGDYDASLIDNDSSVTGTTVKDALNTLLSAIPSVPVSSVFGRTGAVVGATSDYDASQVDNDSSVTGATVKDALNTLQSSIPAIPAHNSLSGLEGGGSSHYFHLTTAAANLAEKTGALRQEPTGFKDTTETTISVNPTTRVVTLGLTGASATYWIQGVEYTMSVAKTVTIPDTDGVHYVYLDGSTLSTSTAANFPAYLRDYALVALVLRDVTGNTALIGDERHGLSMSWATHYNLHVHQGSIFVSGGLLSNFSADGDGSTDAQAQFTVSACTTIDEDLSTVSDSKTLTGSMLVFYRTVGGVWRWNTSSAPLITTGSGRAAYCPAGGGLSEVGNGKFVLAHLWKSNLQDGSGNKPIVAVVGMAEYNDVSAARTAAATEAASLVTTGLPTAEWVLIGSVVYQTSSTYSNTWKSRVRSLSTGVYWEDFRYSRVTGSATITDHGALGGLTDDDHPQYALLAGRSGGQTLYGGTAASENLTLDSTSHATKGSILTSSNFAMSRDSANAALSLSSYKTTSAYGTLSFNRGRGSAASPTDVADTDILGVLDFYGYANGALRRGAYLESNVTGSPGATWVSANMDFRTTNGSGTDILAMRITGSGTTEFSYATTTPALYVSQTAPYIRILETDDTNRYAQITRNGRVTTLESNQVATVAAVPGYALSLAAASNQYASGGPDNDMSGNNFSVEAWVYCTSYATSGLYIRGITCKNNTNVGFNMRLGDGSLLANNSKVSVGMGYTSGAWNGLSTDTVSLNAWNHICVTYDGSNVRIYINGTLDSGGAKAQANGITWNSQTIVVGSDWAPAPTGRTWDGRIDEVAWWNKTLSAAEVLARYNSGNGAKLAGNEASLVYCWHFDENTGTNAANAVATQPALTLQASATWGAGKINISESSTSDTNPYLLDIRDSALSSHYAKLTLGDLNSESVLQGLTTSLTSTNDMTLTAGSAGVGNLQLAARLLPNNKSATLGTATTCPQVYGTTTTGSGYPFTEAGHLVLTPGLTLARDVLVATYSGSGTNYNYPAIFGADGKLYLANAVAATTAPTKDCYLYRDPIGTGNAGVISTDGWFNVNNSAGLTSATIGAATYGASTYSALNLVRARGTKASPTVVTTGDTLGDVSFVARATSGAWGTSGTIRGVVEGSLSGAIVPGRIEFHTQNSSGSLTQAIQIDSSQRLWLGSSTLDCPLFRDAANVIATQRSSADANAQAFAFKKSRGSLTSPSANSSGDTLGTVSHYGYQNSAWRRAAYQAAIVDAAPSGSVVQGKHVFYTTTAAGAETLALTIDSAQKTWFGSTQDTYLSRIAANNLQLGGTDVTSQFFTIYRTYSTTNAAMSMGIASNNSPTYQHLYGGTLSGEKAGTASAANPLFLAALPAGPYFTFGAFAATAGNTFTSANYTEWVQIGSGGTTIAGTLQVNGNTTLGDASTDTITCTGRMIVRTLSADPTANATAGSLGEIAFYSGKWYGKTTASGTDTNWAALN